MDFSTEQLDALWGDGDTRRKDIATRRDYYAGKHAIVGMNAEYLDGNAKSERVTNWIRDVVNRHVGALTGAPWQLTAKDAVGEPEGEGEAVAEPGAEPEPEEAAEPEAVAEYADIAEDQALNAQDLENLKNALIAGYGVEVHSFDAETKVTGITNYDPEEWVFVRATDGATVAAIWRVKLDVGAIHDDEVLADELELMRVYTDTQIVKYEKRRKPDSKEEVQWVLAGEPVKHHYKRVPVIEWRVNPESESVISKALMGMNDEFNEGDSASGDEIRQNVNAILATWGLGGDWVKDNADIVKKLGVLPLPTDGNAKYLIKTTDTARVTERLNRTRSAIHMMGEVPDVGAIVGGTGATSGIALKLMFTPMQEAANTMITYLKQGMRERVDLINAVRVMRDEPPIEDFVVTVLFSMPVNRIEEWQNIKALDGVVSHTKQLEMLTDVDDPERELKALEAEAADKRPELDEPADAQAAVVAQDERIAKQAQALQPTVGELVVALADAVTDYMLKTGVVQAVVDRRQAEAAA